MAFPHGCHFTTTADLKKQQEPSVPHTEHYHQSKLQSSFKQSIKRVVSNFGFVMTQESGEKEYCQSISFLQKVPRSLIDSNRLYEIMDQNITCYYPTSIVILSKYPYHRQFSSLLDILLQVHLKKKPALQVAALMAHLRDSLLMRRPMGMSQGLGIQLKYSLSFLPSSPSLTFVVPASLENLPLVQSLPLQLLLRYVSIENVYILFRALMLERHVIIHCSEMWLLQYVISGLLQLLYPFEWMHVLIPLLPDQL